jgi:hypothetical protein
MGRRFRLPPLGKGEGQRKEIERLGEPTGAVQGEDLGGFEVEHLAHALGGLRVVVGIAGAAEQDGQLFVGAGRIEFALAIPVVEEGLPGVVEDRDAGAAAQRGHGVVRSIGIGQLQSVGKDRWSHWFVCRRRPRRCTTSSGGTRRTQFFGQGIGIGEAVARVRGQAAFD